MPAVIDERPDVSDGASTVADAMVTRPVLCAADSTVGEIRAFFADPHLHSALLVDDRAALIAVLERTDLADALGDARAADLGTLRDRTVPGSAHLDDVRRTMLRTGRRRLAVVDDLGRLVGLLCLKASSPGFCSDADVLRRRTDPRD